MNVRLISYSKPPRMVQIIEQLDPHGDNLEELVAYCARVSNPSNQNNTTTSKNFCGISPGKNIGLRLKWFLLASR